MSSVVCVCPILLLARAMTVSLPRLVGANSYDPNVTGNYTLTSATSTVPVTNCEDVFVLAGISTDQSNSVADTIGCIAGLPVNVELPRQTWR